MPNSNSFCYGFIMRKTLVFVWPMYGMEVISYFPQFAIQFGVSFHHGDFT